MPQDRARHRAAAKLAEQRNISIEDAKRILDGRDAGHGDGEGGPANVFRTVADRIAAFPDSSLLGDAREWLRRHRHEGAQCPACGQRVQVYERLIYWQMAAALLSMYRAYGVGTYGKFDKVVRKRADEAKLAHFGLIVEEPTRNPTGGRPGYWAVTELGGQVVRKEVPVPYRTILLYDGDCIGHRGDPIWLEEALGISFDFDALMTGTWSPPVENPQPKRKSATKADDTTNGAEELSA